MEDYSGYMNTKEAARALRISEPMVRKLHGTGKLPGRKITMMGREVLIFLREDVEAAKERNTQVGRPKKPGSAKPTKKAVADKKKAGPKKS